MDVVPREPAILGGIKKAVKKVGKTVKKIAKSDLGKAALIGAAAFGIPGTNIGGLFGRAGFGGKAAGLLGTEGIGALFANAAMPGTGEALKGTSPFSKALGAIGIGKGGEGMGTFGKVATLGLVSKFLTDTLGMPPEQAEAELARDPSTYLEQYYRNLNPPTADTTSEQYEAQVRDFVVRNTSEYAVGGRVGFATGESGIMKMASALGDESDALAIQLFGKPVKELNPAEMQELQDEIDRLINKFRAEGPVLPPDTTQPVNPFGPKPGDFGIDEDIPIKMASYGYNEAMADTYDSYLDMKKKGLIPPTMSFDEFLQEVVPEMSKRQDMDRTMAAVGGKMDTASDNAMQAAGIEGLPIRQNKAGVKELDLRETGGFIQPVGIKEKEDDIPAMLSNNEFVMTADAVRGMGGGDVNLGAQRMYDQMKMLEAGGKV